MEIATARAVFLKLRALQADIEGEDPSETETPNTR
jgi:hypothetical protein